MPRELELENSANWDLFFHLNLTAEQGSYPNSHKPIPHQEIPIRLDKHVIAVVVHSRTAKSTWHFAGFLGQKIFSGQVVSGAPDTFAVTKRKLWLDQITLLVFPRLTSTYSIFYEVPYWFDEVDFTIWKYIGPDRDSTDDLLEVTRFELAQVRNRVQEIATDLEE